MSNPKPGTLSMIWSKREKDMLIRYPSKPDGHLLHIFLNCERFNYAGEGKPSLVSELEERGYDLTTLRFSVRKKEAP